MGESFQFVGGKSHRFVARVDAVISDVSSWNPYLSGGGVSALALGDGSIVIAAGAGTYKRIVMVDIQTGARYPWDPGISSNDGGVDALFSHGTTLHVGGYFK